MERQDKIYYILSQKAPKIYEDIIVIDGAIEQINVEYKKEVLRRLEGRYYITLNRLKYNLYNKKIDKKIQRDIISLKKALNTKLGTLKLFLTRAAILTFVDRYELEEIIEKIYEENNVSILDEYFAKLDELSYEYI